MQGPVNRLGVLEKGLVEKSIGPKSAEKAVNISEVTAPRALLSLRSSETIRGSGPKYEQTTAFSTSLQPQGSSRFVLHLNQLRPLRLSYKRRHAARSVA